MKSVSALFVAIAISCFSFSSAAIPHLPHHRSSKSCHNSCRFRFCDYKVTFNIQPKPGVAFTGAICSNVGTRIGIVKTTGEAYVFEGRSIIRISKWRPRGLQKPFSSTFFKAFTINHDNVSGIGHEEVHKNQLRFLNKRCFVLPLTSYQLLHRYGYVVGTEHPKGSPLLDCVEFIMRTPTSTSGFSAHSKKALFNQPVGKKFPSSSRKPIGRKF